MDGCDTVRDGCLLKVLVKTPFSQYSGYATDEFGLVRALHEWGCDVYPQPCWLDVPTPRDILPLFAAGRAIRPDYQPLGPRTPGHHPGCPGNGSPRAAGTAMTNRPWLGADALYFLIVVIGSSCGA